MQIVQDLRIVKGRQTTLSFTLYQEAIEDDQVGSIVTVKLDSLIEDREIYFLLKRRPSNPQFLAKCFAIDVLKKPKSKQFVNFKGRAQDDASLGISLFGIHEASMSEFGS